MAWNVMRHAGWRRIGSALCGAIVSRLRMGGPRAVRIVERTRLRPDHPLPGFLTPFGVIWMAWATLTLAGVVSWLAWIWASTIGIGYANHRLREHRARAILTTVGRFHIPSDGD
jgi:hypothetical protein